MARTPNSAGRTLRATLCLASAVIAGCAAISANPAAIDASGNTMHTLIPDKTLNLTPGVGLGIDTILVGAALYWVVDPLAPNWELQRTPLGGNLVRISLRMKRFTNGGDGEAPQVFARGAEQLVREGGYSGYTVMKYTEGIESTLPVPQRVAQGVVRLNR